MMRSNSYTRFAGLITLLCVSLLCVNQLQAKQILRDLKFNTGKWTLIGVPLHNYQLLPVQKDVGTFMTEDVQLMKDIQAAWDFDITFDDNCDYHYALKFYQDENLVKTLKLNLSCSYITIEGMSYEFQATEFDRFRKNAKPINWSRISFGQLNTLKKAVEKLDDTQGIYWYEDVNQYKYSGYFLIGYNQLPWNADLDSMYQEVSSAIEKSSGSTDFYLKEHFHLVDDEELFVRYYVNCERSFAQMAEMQNIFVPWRSHLETTDSIRIVAIGINEKKYWEIMKE